MKYKEAFDNLNNNKKWGVSRFPQVLVEILVVSCDIKSNEFLTSWNFGKFWDQDRPYLLWPTTTIPRSFEP